MADPRVKAIFLEAMECPGAARRALLDASCGDDAALRAEVEALLRASDEADALFEVPTADGPAAAPAARVTVESVPDVIGPYTLDRALGEGGFGTVYLARQESPVRRTVALKIIKPGMHTGQVVRRFEHEREALSLMDHPNIARALDAGETDDGRPYVVMEHVDGSPITTYCDAKRLSIRGRLELFIGVCRAVQHAHQKGVVHRDLKPTNILVTEVDGRPVPKVIDFGIAKAIDDSIVAMPAVTGARQIVGTPQYMAPEQASFDRTGVDTRVDVYSLGVVLYELLAGVTPFDPKRLAGAGPGELERIIREEEPPRPSSRVAEISGVTRIAKARRHDPHRLWREIEGDLDWIVVCAMEKDPARRYPTANALAEDVIRHLRNEPVAAGPPGVRYRLGRFVRRNRLELGAAAVVVLALAALAVGGVTYAIRERDAADRIRDELRKSNALATFAQDILSGVDPAVARDLDTTLLEKILAGATDRVRTELAEQPEAAATMDKAIGYTYAQIGRFDLAEGAVRAGLLRAERELGDEDTLTLSLRESLGTIVGELGRHDEALRLMESVAATRRRVNGVHHAETLAAMGNLGGLYYRLGRLEEAKALLEETLAIHEADEHPDADRMEAVMNHLGLVYGDLDQPARGAALLERVLERQIAAKTEMHPRTLATMNNLAMMYDALERHDDVRAMFERIIEVKQRILPPDHPSIIVTRVNQASMELAHGDAATAEAEFRDILASARRSGSAQGRLGALNGLGRALSALDRPAEAEPLVIEAAELAAELFPPSHPTSIIMQINCASVHHDMGELERAAREADAVASLATECFGPTHDKTVAARKILARCLAGTGRVDEATALLATVHAACVETLGADHERTIAVAALRDELSAPADSGSVSR